VRILTKLKLLLRNVFRKKQASIYARGVSQLNRGTTPRAWQQNTVVLWFCAS